MLTQLPSAIARALARQTSLAVLDWQGEDPQTALMLIFHDLLVGTCEDSW